MPTYEYHCEVCNKVVEIFHSMTAKPAEVCPNCGKKALRRLISGGTGIIFKGHGFYCTDYKNSSSTPASTTPASSSEHETSVKSDPKPEKKAEKKTTKSDSVPKEKTKA